MPVMKQTAKSVMDNIPSSPNKATPSRAEAWKMFDRVVHRYDLLNRLLSLRRDVAWRNKVAKYLPDRTEQRVLDLATGTGDILLSLFEKSDRIQSAIGIDMAEKMLERSRKKIAARKLDDRVFFIRADAVQIPFSSRSFDAVTIAFGIRNVPNVPRALAEMRRVLKPGGKALILEFSLPPNRFLRRLYLFYLRKILPRLGAVISGDSYAYRYLNETIETFPYGGQFCDMMERVGFVNVEAVPLTFGTATIYQGSR